MFLSWGTQKCFLLEALCKTVRAQLQSQATRALTDLSTETSYGVLGKCTDLSEGLVSLLHHEDTCDS